MTDDVSLIFGSLFVFVICAWAVASLAGQLRRNVMSQTAVDRTLSDVDKRDAPALFTLQLIGLIAVMIAAAFIGAGALIVMVNLIVRFVAA